MAIVWRALRAMLTYPLALLLLFEEWGWGRLGRALAWLGQLSWWGRAERWIGRLPRWAALAVFGLPMLALLPIKLAALWLFAGGHTAVGLGLLVAAKLGGTAAVARLFTLTQPALLQFGWFARWYPRWKAWKDRVLDEVRQSAPWRAARSATHKAKAWWKDLTRAN